MRCVSVRVHLVLQDTVLIVFSWIAQGVPGEHVVDVCSCRWISSHSVVQVIVHVLEGHLVLEGVLVAHESCKSFGDLAHAGRSVVEVLLDSLWKRDKWMLDWNQWLMNSLEWSLLLLCLYSLLYSYPWLDRHPHCRRHGTVPRGRGCCRVLKQPQAIFTSLYDVLCPFYRVRG